MGQKDMTENILLCTINDCFMDQLENAQAEKLLLIYFEQCTVLIQAATIKKPR